MKDYKVGITVSVVSAVVVAVLFLVFGANTEKVTERIIEKANKEQGVNFGALTGPDLSIPYLNVNGNKEWPLKLSFKNATGTVVAVQSPSASSTLAFRVDVRVATATATIIEVSTSTNAVSTSSANRLGSLTLASGARGSLVGTSTNFCFGGTPCTFNVGNGLATTTWSNFAKLSETVIPPDTWVVFRVGAEYGGNTDITNNTVTTVFTEI